MNSNQRCTVLKMNSILILPDKNLLRVIKDDLGEDTARLQKQIEMFREWLRCEPHLPKDVDENVVQTFVRSCKCDLEKSKQKFEKFLFTRFKLRTYYIWQFDENFFKRTPVHKQMVLCPELTPKGYRIMMYSLPTDLNDFIFADIVRYMLFLLDYLFFEDTAAGFIFVCDIKPMTIQHIAKVNIGDALKLVDLIYNISPLRTKAIHFLHLPAVAASFISLIIKAMSEKIQKRVQMHKTVDLTKILPKHIVPRDYGGSGMSFAEHGEGVLHYLKKNPDWIAKTKNLKLAGTIPQHKKTLYSFEEFEMVGTFRKLAID